jgi:hypothetical protein
MRAGRRRGLQFECGRDQAHGAAAVASQFEGLRADDVVKRLGQHHLVDWTGAGKNRFSSLRSRYMDWEMLDCTACYLTRRKAVRRASLPAHPSPLSPRRRSPTHNPSAVRLLVSCELPSNMHITFLSMGRKLAGCRRHGHRPRCSIAPHAVRREVEGSIRPMWRRAADIPGPVMLSRAAHECCLAPSDQRDTTACTGIALHV